MNDLVSLPHDTTVEAAAQVVRDHGYVIVRDVLSGKRLERLRAELEPHLDAIDTGAEDFGGLKTKRFGALLRRVPMSRENALARRSEEAKKRRSEEAKKRRSEEEHRGLPEPGQQCGELHG